MITRTHTSDTTHSSAVYSDCEAYRYSLTRIWDENGARVLFVMLNPSKATELANDPTIERCEQRARRLGYGGFCAANIFALRATDPKDLKAHPAPEGADNLGALDRAGVWADTIIAAWGVHGAHLDQGPRIARHLLGAGHRLHHLGLTKHGHPRHPLYLPYAAQPQPWTPQA